MGYKFAPLVFSGLIPTGGGAISWRGAVDAEINLPSSGNTDGDAIVVKSTNSIYIWGGGKWNDTTLDVALFGTTPNTQGYAFVTDDTDPLIRRITLELEPADGTNPGGISIVDQSLSGNKTFLDSIISIGVVDAQGGLDSSAGTLDIGATATTINIGAPGATITIQGDTTYEHVTNLYVKDKTITINDGGGVASGAGSGIEVEEDGAVAGHVQVSSTRDAWELKAPLTAGVASIIPGAAGITIDQSSHDSVTLATVGTAPNADGATLIGQVLNLEPADGTNPGVVSTGAQNFAGDKTFDESITVVGTIDAQTSVGSSTGTLVLGDVNTTTINLGEPGGATTSILQTGAINSQGYPINNVGQFTTAPTANDNLYVNISPTTMGPGADSVSIGFTQSPGVDSADITFQSNGVLFLNSSLLIQASASSMTVDSPDIDLGQSAGTTDIIGTVTIQYNPADPTDWAPAPTHVIEAIDQLAERFVEQDQVTNEPTGFPNRDDSEILFSDGGGTPTFTIQPKAPATSYDIYIRGKKFTKTGAETVTTVSHPSFPYAGNNYFYFDENGDLQVTNTFSAAIIQQYAFISIAYWNPDTNTHTYFAEERHGLTMDGVTHSYLHTVFGARYLSGLALQNFTIGTGGANADAQFDVDQGSIRDEDILHQLAAEAQIPILYRLGSNGYWRKKTADAFPVIYSGTAGYTGANGRLPYSQYSGGSWSLTQVSNNKYVLVHFFGTNDKENGVVGIQGIAEYDSMEAARTGANSEISSLSGLPFAEFVPIGTVLFQTSNTFANTPKADVIPVDGTNYVDFRGTQLYTPAGTATTHGLLSGLGNDDHFQYLLVDGTRAMSGDLSLGGHNITNTISVQFEDPGVGSNKITIQAPTLAADYTLTLPTDDGINQQYLKTNGSGSLTWEFPKNNGTIYHVSSDGRSEYTTIQSAINAAEAAGAAYLNPKYIIVHGEFTEDLTISKTGIFLIGETSQENLLNRINGSLTINKLVNIPGEAASSSVIYVGGLTITKSSDNFIRFTGTNPQRVKFEGCTLVSSANSVMLCDNTGVGSKVTIRNCTIQTNGAAKKSITMSNGWIDIRNSIVENTASGGIAISGADSVLTTISNTEISGQLLSTVASTFVISTSSITTASGSAIATTSSSYVAISNSGLSVPFGTSSVTGTGALYFADIVNNGLGGGFASTVPAVGFTNDVGNLRLPNRGTISLSESLSNGQNTTTLQAANSIASNFTYTLPDALPSTNNSAIVSNSSGTLSYVYVTASSFGDISKSSTSALNNQAVAQNIAGLSFLGGTTNSFDVQICVVRDSTYAEYNIRGVYKTASSTWEISQEYVGDDTGITFSITSAGQFQYTSTNTGFNATLYYRAITV